jgi:hypothetical protein
MEDWQSKALNLFPDVDAAIDRGPMGLWVDLHLALIAAYDESPVNDDLIGRIYDFAAWCLKQPETGDAETDLSSAAAVGLIEDIPLERRVSEDLYRWLSVETFEGFENLFRYHLSDEEYRRFHDEFIRKKREYSGKPRL